MKKLFADLVKNGMAANDAAATALKMIAAGEVLPRHPKKTHPGTLSLYLLPKETLRRMIHDHIRQPILKKPALPFAKLSW